LSPPQQQHSAWFAGSAVFGPLRDSCPRPRYNTSACMAARLQLIQPRPGELVDLRGLSARDLEPLLEEEIASWRDDLEWQFDESANLVRRFVDLRALTGSALIEQGKPIG